MLPRKDGEATTRPVSDAALGAIKTALTTHLAAVVAAAHTTTTGTLVVQLHQDMAFGGAQVVPDGTFGSQAQGVGPDYRVRLCRIVAWRPWGQREIEAAIKEVDGTAIE